MSKKVTGEVIAKPKPLTAAQKQELTGLEAKITTLHRAFVDAGMALKKIRDDSLYSGTHGSFNDYVRDRWSFTRRRADQLIAASGVVMALKKYHLTPLPANEGQVRMLLSVSDDVDEQTDVWEKIVAKAENKKITAALIKEICDEEEDTEEEDTEEEDTEEEDTEEEETVEGVMKNWNKGIESWAREVVAKLKEVPQGPWIDETRIGIMQSELRSLTATVRATKGYKVCPKCEGKGCKRCRDTGFVPKVEYDSMGGG
jgi:hypothetical protein